MGALAKHEVDHRRGEVEWLEGAADLLLELPSLQHRPEIGQPSKNPNAVNEERTDAQTQTDQTQ